MADDTYKQLNFTATEIDTILAAVAGKQDALPAGSNGTYLHRNDTTGALEFVEIPENAYIIEGSLTGEPEDHTTPITITSNLQDICDKYQEAPETRFVLKLYDNNSEVIGIFNLTPGGFSPSLDSNLVIGFMGSAIGLFEIPIQNAYHQQDIIVEFGISETGGVYSAEGIYYFTNKIPDSDLCVTVTYNSGTDTYIIDKTYDDFQKIAVLFGQTAFSEIPTVLAMYNNKLYTLNNYDSAGWTFTAIEPTSATVFTRYVLNILWEQDTQNSSVYNYSVSTYTYTIDTNPVDLSNYVTLNGTQTITGTKTFNANLDLLNAKYLRGTKVNGTTKANLIGIDSSDVIQVGNTSTALKLNTNTAVNPSSDWAKDLGSSSLRWKDIYLAGKLKDGNNANYGVEIPDTTSWTANKTLATEDQLPEGEIDVLFNDSTVTPTTTVTLSNIVTGNSTDGYTKYTISSGGMTNPMTTAGDIIVGGSSGTPARLGLGTAGQVLKVNSGATGVEWANESAGMTDPTTTQGDLLIRGASTIERLGIGTNGQVLTSNGTTASWQTPSGSGVDNISIVNALPSVSNAQNNILYKLNNDLYALTETEQVAPVISYSNGTLTAVVDYDAESIELYADDTLIDTISITGGSN